MNDSIQKSLAEIAHTLRNDPALPFEALDNLYGEVEMIKLEIEQHLSNLPQDSILRELRSAAEDAVDRLAEVLARLEELEDPSPDHREALVDEISELIGAIHY